MSLTSPSSAPQLVLQGGGGGVVGQVPYQPDLGVSPCEQTDTTGNTTFPRTSCVVGKNFEMDFTDFSFSAGSE